MNYVYCPVCKASQRASVGRAGRIICDACETDYSLEQFSSKVCPGCGSQLYALPRDLEDAECPCGREGVRNTGAEHPAAEESGYPQIPCECCGKPLPFTGNGYGYGTCLSCGKKPSELYLHNALYQINETLLPPHEYKWNPKPLEMLHLDPFSHQIPYHSILIVGEQQEAVYFAGGICSRIREADTYQLSDDPRTREEIIEGIGLGNVSEDSSDYRLNTSIIFFDKHKQDVSFETNFSLNNNAWLVFLPVDLSIQICAVENLLRNQMDYSDAKAVVQLLLQKIQGSVKRELKKWLFGIPADKLTEAETEEAFQRVLSAAFDADKEDLRQRINTALIRDYGIQIVSLCFQLEKVRCISTADAEEIVCPHCHQSNWIKKGSRDAIQCESCGERLSWCYMCRKFTASVKTDNNAERCAEPLCGHIKI